MLFLKFYTLLCHGRARTFAAILKRLLEQNIYSIHILFAHQSIPKRWTYTTRRLCCKEKNYKVQKEDTMKCCGKGSAVACRLLLLVIGLTALVFNGLSIVSCRFLHYAAPVVDPNTDYNPPLGMDTDSLVGLFRYDPDFKGCRRLPEPDNNLDNEFRAARAGTCVALVAGAVALLLLWIEFTCWSCCGVRFWAGLFLALAMLTQALTFLLFNSNICRSTEDIAYTCKIDQGSYYSFAAIGLYLVTSILVCTTPKPEPACVKIRQEEKNDPCICCPRKKSKDDEEQDVEAAEAEAAKEGENVDEDIVVVPVAAPKEEEEVNDEAVERELDAGDEKDQDLLASAATGAEQSAQMEERRAEPQSVAPSRYQDVVILDNDMFFDSKDQAASSRSFRKSIAK